MKIVKLLYLLYHSTVVDYNSSDSNIDKSNLAQGVVCC